MAEGGFVFVCTCLSLAHVVSGQGLGLADYNPLHTTVREGIAHSDVGIGEYDPRYGTYVGPFSTIWHDVVGDVYAVDNITIAVRGFSYDGEAPDAHFFAGNKTPEPSNRGFIIPNDKNQIEVLGPYNRRNFVLHFPVTKKGQRGFFDVQWISVWCKKFAIDFGHVPIPAGLRPPAPAMGGALNAPGLSARYVMRSDTKYFTIVDFTYDGRYEGAILVMTYEDGTADPLPDEDGDFDPLESYSRRTIDIEIPDELRSRRVHSIGVYSAKKGGMIAEARLEQSDRLPPSLR